MKYMKSPRILNYIEAEEVSASGVFQTGTVNIEMNRESSEQRQRVFTKAFKAVKSPAEIHSVNSIRTELLLSMVFFFFTIIATQMEFIE